jgi:hypothetical protein
MTYVPPTTPNLGLSLPSPDAPSQREDVTRMAAAITGLDAAVAAQSEGVALAQAAAEDAEILALALGS